MSARQAELAARIESVGQLGTVIRAVRGIAAASASRTRGQLEGVRSYARTVAEAMASALALVPEEPEAPVARSGAPIVVVLCAELGFAGAFSERVFDAIAGEAGDACLLVVGRRGQRVAASRRLVSAWTSPGIAHGSAAAGLAERITGEILRRFAAGEATSAGVVHNRCLDGTAIDIERTSLLPLDLRRFRRPLHGPPPIVQLEPEQLVRDLALEYLRAQLIEAILHSFAAESMARLLSMSAARENIARMLETLQRDERTERQESITAEIVELSGVRA